jgi:hypothetical protein
MSQKIRAAMLRRLLVVFLAGAIIGGVAVAAAMMYSYNLTARSVTQTGPVAFKQGSDNIATIGTGGTTATVNPAIIGNVTATYTDGLNITDQDGNSHSILLSVSSMTGSTAVVQELDLYFVQPNGTQILAAKVLNGAVTQANSGWRTFPANANWAIKIVTIGASGITLGQTVSVNLGLSVQ